MRSLRLAVAATALALITAPFASAPASASVCNPTFQVVCDVIGIVCNALNELPGDPVACQLA